MKKTKFTLEYPLKTTPIGILWNSIGTPQGLSEWFADEVTKTGNFYSFTWGKTEQKAILLDIKLNRFIRFQWVEDEKSEYYFEISIKMLEITGEMSLTITDFAEENEQDDIILLWNKEIRELKRKMGM